MSWHYTAKNPKKIWSFSPKIEDFFFQKMNFLIKFASQNENFLLDCWISANLSQKSHFEKKSSILREKYKIFSAFLLVYMVTNKSEACKTRSILSLNSFIFHYTGKNPEKILSFSQKVEDFFLKMEFFFSNLLKIQQIWAKKFPFWEGNPQFLEKGTRFSPHFFPL